MALTAFTRRLGVGQGRIRPTGAPVPSGEYVFVLGEDEPGYVFDLAVGDHVEITQSTDVTGMALVRAGLTFRVPNGIPAGFAWEASLVVDGSKIARARTRPGRQRVITDLAANVSKLTGVHTVGVRLELIAV